ncbi:Uncharacterized protein BP5553_04110 [Venustampulla echinocandica]|uniref:Uncharacterized protein n=1 Tax=Venustampulla echinocandica TaxID=2656787 RepID=A0A370TW66_9HELO|nr:Uncharacterized protein BP5553_04110 [Venustampulla echinocandica]RDL39770.1 Uncharacterized protein BP5553_04110 [Venustampulla echinocandica]
MSNDSPLDITASIAGILTFVVAIAAALYARFTYLRNADSEYFQVKASLSWYKTESTWMNDLIQSGPASDGAKGRSRVEHEMYSFVMDQIGKLEERLLGLLTEAEVSATKESEKEEGWTIVPRRMKGRTDIAMSWLPVRAKALELVRQRDALGSRVLFAQMSMISSAVRDQEARSRKRDESQRERLDSLETMVYAQHEKLDRLEDLVYRAMHRSTVVSNGNPESPRYEEYPRHEVPQQHNPEVQVGNTRRRSAEVAITSLLPDPGRMLELPPPTHRIPTI